MLTLENFFLSAKFSDDITVRKGEIFMNLIELLSFGVLKTLAEKKALVIFVLLVSEAMKEVALFKQMVEAQLSVDDIATLTGADKADITEKLKLLESLNLIKLTGSHILVGKVVDEQFYLLNEKTPQNSSKKEMPKVITGRYIPLAKKEEDYEVVECLIHMNRLFYTEFGFSETTILPKQLNSLKSIYNISGLNLKQIYKVYKFYLKNFRTWGVNSPTMPAFNGFFNAVIMDYKQLGKKSYDQKEETKPAEVFSGFVGRHHE